MTENSKSLTTQQNSLIDRYNHPIVKALVAFITGVIPFGVGGAVKELLDASISEIVSNRKKEFFDELAKGQVYLTEELIQSEDFIHAFVSTHNAAVKTRQREKIRLFARMLINSIRNPDLNWDEFEEFLSIVDELSLRELKLLIILRDFETNYPSPDIPSKREQAYKAEQFWPEFKEKVERELNINSDEIPMILVRLSRTGFCETFTTGMSFGTSMSSGFARLTPIFDNFIRWIETENIEN